VSEAAPVGLRALVHGRVQGVGFRAYVRSRARQLELRGFARNLSDGSTVEVIAEGPRAALDLLIEALRIGPPGAEVESVDAAWGGASGGYEGFAVR
jgi:acylphosphatase